MALAVSLLYVAALTWPVQQHIVGVFSDFYVRFAPDADRIAAGAFPENTYNPPGYPVLLALASRLTGDHFTSGKWMSLAAAGLTGVLTFLLVQRLFGPNVALLAVPIVLTSEAFTTYAVTAMTDVPFVCVLLLAMLAITQGESGTRRRVWTAVSGVLCGGAYLMRYNALFLLVPGLAAAVWEGSDEFAPRSRSSSAPGSPQAGTRGRSATCAPRRSRSSSAPGSPQAGTRGGSDKLPPDAAGGRLSRAINAAIFLGSVAVTASPWLWANYAHHGSPFYSTNYEDVARAFAISRPHPFTSLLDVVAHDPVRLAWGYARNV